MSNDINVWDFEEKIRNQLAAGVRFEDSERGARIVAVPVDIRWFTWVKYNEKTKTLTVIYVRGAVRVTVEAKVVDVRKKEVEITGVSLDSMCGCICGGGRV